MLNFRILESALDDYGFCSSPGQSGDLYHLVDDSFIGFNFDDENKSITFFNFYDCDFNVTVDEYVKQALYWKYDLDQIDDIITFTNILFEHELIQQNEDTVEDSKNWIIDTYNEKMDHLQNLKKLIHNEIVEDSNLSMAEKALVIKMLNITYPNTHQIRTEIYIKGKKKIDKISCNMDLWVMTNFYEIFELLEYLKSTYFQRIFKI